MIIIRDPTLTSIIHDPGIRSLAETRLARMLFIEEETSIILLTPPPVHINQ